MGNEIISSVDTANVLVELPAQNLLESLMQKNATIAVAEGCTGGRILNSITIPGSTNVFRIGTIAYSRKSKELLGVESNVIEKYGEYSPEVAIEMAKAVRRLRNDTLGIATTGELKADGTVSTIYFASASINGSFHCAPIDIGEKFRDKIKSIASSESLIMSFNDIQENRKKINDSITPKTIIVGTRNKDENHAHQLLTVLKKEGLSISTAESCTGGALGDMITDIPGSSHYFDSSWVLYDENSKALFGVPLSTMTYGQVYSAQVAEEMAKALYRKTKTDIVISTTGTMDNWDTRPYHLNTPPGVVYYSIGIYGRFFTRKIQLIPKKRSFMKNELVKIIFEDLIFLAQLKNEIFRSPESA